MRIDTPKEAELLPPRGHPAVRPATSCSRREALGRSGDDDARAAGSHSGGRERLHDRRIHQTLRDLLAARGPSRLRDRPRGGLEWRPLRPSARRWRPTWWGLPPQGCPRARVGQPIWSTHTSTPEGKAATRRLIVMGHIDEIGLIVTHIDDEGYLWFREVGGWDAQILVGQRVVLGHARGRGRGGDRQEADPPAARRGAQEGGRGARPAHRHRCQGRRRRHASSCASATWR